MVQLRRALVVCQKWRVPRTKKAFQYKRNSLISSQIDLEERKAFAKTFNWSIWLYGRDLDSRGKKVLCGCRNGKRKQVVKHRYRQSGGKRKNGLIKENRIKFIWHLLGHITLIFSILEGILLEKRWRDRPEGRKSMMWWRCQEGLGIRWRVILTRWCNSLMFQWTIVSLQAGVHSAPWWTVYQFYRHSSKFYF